MPLHPPICDWHYRSNQPMASLCAKLHGWRVLVCAVCCTSCCVLRVMCIYIIYIIIYHMYKDRIHMYTCRQQIVDWHIHERHLGRLPNATEISWGFAAQVPSSRPNPRWGCYQLLLAQLQRSILDNDKFISYRYIYTCCSMSTATSHATYTHTQLKRHAHAQRAATNQASTTVS